MYYAALHELNLMRIRAVNWFKEQNGGVTVIEIIIILAIVIALGIIMAQLSRQKFDVFIMN